MFGEATGEIFGVVEADFVCYFGDRNGCLFRRLHQLFRFRETVRADHFHGRLPYQRLQFLMKQAFAHVHLLDQLCYVESGILVVFLYHFHQLIEELPILRLFPDIERLYIQTASEGFVQAVLAFEHVIDTGYQQLGIKRFGDITVCSYLIPLDADIRRCFGRQQQDRNMGSRKVILHLLTKLQAVHHRHHDIGNDKVGQILQRLFQCRLAVGSLDDREFVFQYRLDKGPHIGIVLGHEQQRFVLIHRLMYFFILFFDLRRTVVDFR